MSKKEPKAFEEFRTNELTRVIPTDLIDFNPWNPNEQDDKTFEQLVKDMREIGRLIDPIQIIPKADGRFMVLGGEHRLKAARALGWVEIPATLLTETQWSDGDYQKFLTVKMNVLKGNLNPEKMARLYTEMSEKYGSAPLQALFGMVDQEAWDKVVKGIGKGIKKTLPKPLADKYDELSKKAKDSKDLGLILNQLMAEYSEDLDQSFMIFTYGTEHIYVKMNENMRSNMKKVLGFCKKYNRDVNDVIEVLTAEWVKEANKIEKLEKTKKGSDQGEIEADQLDLKSTGADY